MSRIIMLLIVMVAAVSPLAAQQQSGFTNPTPACDQLLQILGHNAEVLNANWRAIQPSSDPDYIDTARLLIKDAKLMVPYLRLVQNKPASCPAAVKVMPHLYGASAGRRRMGQEQLLDELSIMAVMVKQEPVIDSIEQDAIQRSQQRR